MRRFAPYRLSVTPASTGLPSGSSLEERALRAVMRCVARYGVSKTTLDDVAKEAGCSRATIYRYFPNKSRLVEAAVASEVAALGADLKAVGERADSLEEAVVAIVVQGSRRIVEHDALQFVLRCEPEVLLPYLTFTAGDRFLADAGKVVAVALGGHVSPQRAARAGEWIVRVAFAYLTPAGSPVDMTDEREVAELVRTFVIPGLVAEPTNPITR
jgi:AcrR family transcriptional regulator